MDCGLAIAAVVAAPVVAGCAWVAWLGYRAETARQRASQALTKAVYTQMTAKALARRKEG